MDAGLIAAAQAAEHYEIARYGTLSAWAKMLDMGDAQKILHTTLEEEKQTDEKLSKLAMQQVNRKAA
jgi:ferritin-like metal-binding protein YciE